MSGMFEPVQFEWLTANYSLLLNPAKTEILLLICLHFLLANLIFKVLSLRAILVLSLTLVYHLANINAMSFCASQYSQLPQNQAPRSF